MEAAAFWHGGERQSERLSDPAWTVEKVAALQDSITSDTARALRESWRKQATCFVTISFSYCRLVKRAINRTIHLRSTIVGQA